MTKTVLPIYRHNLMIYPHWKTRILLFHQFMFKFWSFSKVKRSFTVQSKSLASTRRALRALKRLRKSWGIQLSWRRNKMDGWKRDGTIPWWSYDVTILVPSLLSFKETNFQICVLRGFWRYETNFIKFTLFAVAFSNQIAPTLSMLFRTCRTLRPSWLRLPQCWRSLKIWMFFWICFPAPSWFVKSWRAKQQERRGRLIRKEYLWSIWYCFMRPWTFMAIVSESLLKTFEVFLSMRLSKFHF